MNFLAHAYLGGKVAEHRLGGFLGDFVKGPLDNAPGGLPAEVLAGVELHRRLDSFAETHPAFCHSRERISPARRRVAGIMVDLFYDHFLARDWAEWSALAAGDLPDQELAVRGARDHGRRRPSAFAVGNDHRPAALDGRGARVGGTQVDADDPAHASSSGGAAAGTTGAATTTSAARRSLSCSKYPFCNT